MFLKMQISALRDILRISLMTSQEIDVNFLFSKKLQTYYLDSFLEYDLTMEIAPSCTP